MDQKNHPPASLAWLVWGLGAAFYSAALPPVAPAVMTDQLMAISTSERRHWAISPPSISNSYFLVQVPTGILADHWGPRKLLTPGRSSPPSGPSCLPSASSLPRLTWEGSLSVGRQGSDMWRCSRLRRAGFRPGTSLRSAVWPFSVASPAPYRPASAPIPRRTLRLAAGHVRGGGGC